MSSHLIKLESTPLDGVRQRMIRELETFLAATLDRPAVRRVIPVRAATGVARYDGTTHVVVPGEK